MTQSLASILGLSVPQMRMRTPEPREVEVILKPVAPELRRLLREGVLYSFVFYTPQRPEGIHVPFNERIWLHHVIVAAVGAACERQPLRVEIRLVTLAERF